jgi:hypothetical protein
MRNAPCEQGRLLRGNPVFAKRLIWLKLNNSTRSQAIRYIDVKLIRTMQIWLGVKRDQSLQSLTELVDTSSTLPFRPRRGRASPLRGVARLITILHEELPDLLAGPTHSGPTNLSFWAFCQAMRESRWELSEYAQTS